MSRCCVDGCSDPVVVEIDYRTFCALHFGRAWEAISDDVARAVGARVLLGEAVAVPRVRVDSVDV